MINDRGDGRIVEMEMLVVDEVENEIHNGRAKAVLKGWLFWIGYQLSFHPISSLESEPVPFCCGMQRPACFSMLRVIT